MDTLSAKVFRARAELLGATSDIELQQPITCNEQALADVSSALWQEKWGNRAEVRRQTNSAW